MKSLKLLVRVLLGITSLVLLSACGAMHISYDIENSVKQTNFDNNEIAEVKKEFEKIQKMIVSAKQQGVKDFLPIMLALEKENFKYFKFVQVFRPLVPNSLKKYKKYTWSKEDILGKILKKHFSKSIMDYNKKLRKEAETLYGPYKRFDKYAIRFTHDNSVRVTLESTIEIPLFLLKVSGTPSIRYCICEAGETLHDGIFTVSERYYVMLKFDRKSWLLKDVHFGSRIIFDGTLDKIFGSKKKIHIEAGVNRNRAIARATNTAGARTKEEELKKLEYLVGAALFNLPRYEYPHLRRGMVEKIREELVRKCKERETDPYRPRPRPLSLFPSREEIKEMKKRWVSCDLRNFSVVQF